MSLGAVPGLVETKEAYGDTKFGQGCLLARRLVETGVSFVKAFYRRPLSHGGVQVPEGGGRVNHLMARPALAFRLLRMIPVSAVARLLLVKAITGLRSKRG